MFSLVGSLFMVAHFPLLQSAAFLKQKSGTFGLRSPELQKRLSASGFSKRHDLDMTWCPNQCWNLTVAHIFWNLLHTTLYGFDLWAAWQCFGCCRFSSAQNQKRTAASGWSSRWTSDAGMYYIGVYIIYTYIHTYMFGAGAHRRLRRTGWRFVSAQVSCHLITGWTWNRMLPFGWGPVLETCSAFFCYNFWRNLFY